MRSLLRMFPVVQDFIFFVISAAKMKCLKVINNMFDYLSRKSSIAVDLEGELLWSSATALTTDECKPA